MLKKIEFQVLDNLIEKTNFIINCDDYTKIINSLERKGYVKNNYVTNLGFNEMEQYRVKRVIIIAAGFGKRMVPVTLTTPKSLVKVNGIRMIDTILNAIIETGIEEIIIVRGYLGEKFDQLLGKYPQIHFVDNPNYNKGDNIISAMCVNDLFSNAYVMDGDFILNNPKLFRKYEYESMHCGIPISKTDDWCLEIDENNYITNELYGGKNTHLGISLSYWTKEDGIQLGKDVSEVYNSEEGKQRYWQAVPFNIKKENYRIKLRNCSVNDIIEIDSFNELIQIDPSYMT